MLKIDKPFLIGETAAHHEGDFEFLQELVDAGLKAGVDTIKFHLLFDVDDYLVADHAAMEIIQGLGISVENWQKMHDSLIERKVRPVYLCNDVAALKWVNSLPEKSVFAVELHATGINDLFLMQEALRFDGTIMLGAGGSLLDDLYYAISFFRENGKSDILLMHGFQSYPTDYREIVFSKMSLLRDTFGLSVGYADHTDPADELNAVISCLPQSHGFTILEKHFTTRFGEKRIDAQAAVSMEQLQKIVSLMHTFHQTYGTDALAQSPAEKKYGDTGPLKKAIVARKDLQKGHILTLEDVAFKRTNHSVPIRQKDLNLLIGGEVKADLKKDTPLTFEHISYVFNAADTQQFFIKK